jgi:hypothetical protein
MFEAWGVDYIKLDGTTNNNTADIEASSNAIQKSGRPMVLGVTLGEFTQAFASTGSGTVISSVRFQSRDTEPQH